MTNSLYDLRDYFLYDLLRTPLPYVEILEEKNIFKQDFELHRTAEGGIIAESKSYPGLYACATNLVDLREALYDTIMVYFDIPRSVAIRRRDDFELNLADGTVVKAESKASEYAVA